MFCLNTTNASIVPMASNVINAGSEVIHSILMLSSVNAVKIFAHINSYTWQYINFFSFKLIKTNSIK